MGFGFGCGCDCGKSGIACGFNRAGSIVPCNIPKSGLVLEYGNASFGVSGPHPLLFRTGDLTLVPLDSTTPVVFEGPFWYTEPAFTIPGGEDINDKRSFFLFCPHFHFAGGSSAGGEFLAHRTLGNPSHYLIDDGTDVEATTNLTSSALISMSTEWDAGSECDPLDLIREHLDVFDTYINVYES